MVVSIIMSCGIIPLLDQPQQVQAISKYSYHWHWVTSTKNVPVYKVKVGKYMYQSKLVDKVWLPKGVHFLIRYPGHEYPWQLKKLGAGMGGYRVVLRQKANWFRNGKK